MSIRSNSRLMLRLRTLALACLPWIGGCVISMPYKSLELPATGSPDDKLQVSVTHARLYPDKRAAFDEQTMVVYKAMSSQPGLVAYAIKRELFGNQVWTLSVWRDTESRMTFFSSPLHQRAIALSEDAIELVRYRRMEISRSELPMTWERALTLFADQKVAPKPRLSH